MDMTVSLTDELASFVETKVSDGGYRSSSEVVLEALRRMANAEAQETEALRRAWQAGLVSGDAGELDFDALKREARARLATSSPKA